MKLNKIIFPHVNDKKQKKETQFMFCYNIYLIDYRNLNDQEFKNYFKSLVELSKSNMKNNLMGFEEAADNMKNRVRSHIERPGTGNSAAFGFRFISPKEKQEMDNYLIMSGYQRKLDKFSYITEGCMNEEQIFVGGKTELLLNYCKLFPYNSICVNLKKKLEYNRIDKKMDRIFSNPETTDKIVDNFIKWMDQDENEAN